MIEFLFWLLLLALLVAAVVWYFRRAGGKSLADLSNSEAILLSLVLILALLAAVRAIGALAGEQ